MKSELERYKAALSALDEFMDDILEHAKYGSMTDNREILKLAIQLMKGDAETFALHVKHCLHPPPGMEAVEVVRWYYPAGDEIVDRSKSPHFGDHELVKLTGTLKRPKPHPVERTWTLEGAALDKESFGAFSHVKVCPFPDGAPLGKIGTLTFTWQE